MHVTILTNEYSPHIYGGAGVHVEYLTRALARLALVEVISFGDQHQPEGNPTVHGVPTGQAPDAADPRHAKLFDTLHRNLQMAAKVRQPHIVHGHTWYSHWAGCLVKRLSGAKLVLTTHSLEPHRPWKAEQLGTAYHVSSWIEKTAYQDADGVIAVSEDMRKDVTDLYQLDPERVTVIPNGIDADEYRPTFNSDLLRRYGVDPTRPYVLFVGRITRQKGIIHLVRAIGQLTPGTQVVLAAGAPDTEEIATEMSARVAAAQHAGTHCVVWIQEMVPRADLIVLYSHARVFVCPSVYEPFGIINLEAMACETAVVASDVGGIPSVVVHGSTGTLVDLSDQGSTFAAALARAIDALMANPDLCKAYGTAGRARVEAQFSWDAIALETFRYYESLL